MSRSGSQWSWCMLRIRSVPPASSRLLGVARCRAAVSSWMPPGVSSSAFGIRRPSLRCRAPAAATDSAGSSLAARTAATMVV